MEKGFHSDEVHQMLLRTIHHFLSLKSEYQTGGRGKHDCLELNLLFAQSLPQERYEKALSYELFRYGQVILGIGDTGTTIRQTDKPYMKDKALQAIIGLYKVTDDLGLAGDKAQRAFATAVDRLLDLYVRQNFGSLKSVERTDQSVLPELQNAIVRDFTPFVSRLVTLFDGTQPALYREEADIMISDQMLEKWQAAALDKLGQIRSSQVLDILLTVHKGHVFPAPLQDLKVSGFNTYRRTTLIQAGLPY